MDLFPFRFKKSELKYCKISSSCNLFQMSKLYHYIAYFLNVLDNELIDLLQNVYQESGQP